MNVPDTGEVEQLLGPLPPGHAEEPERFPGGADSVADQEKYGEIPDAPLVPDAPPRENPATSKAPDEVTEGDDKPQAPTDASDADAGAGDQEANTPDADQATAEDTAGGEPGAQATEPES